MTDTEVKAASSDWGQTFNDLWWQLGPETKSAITDLLPEGWQFEGKRVLDFGCGPGRTLRHFLDEAQSAEIWGVDVDKRSIDELRATHVPPLHAAQCGYAPPLELEPDSFDLAWAISVFTHLTDNSIAWLLELHRVLKPGGLLIATYMGRWTSEFVAREPWDEDRVGMNVLRHNNPWEQGGPFVFISDWWLREHWGRAFDVLDIAPRVHNQSWALLRKREVQLSEDDILRPGDDPREWLAVKHNLLQAQREIESGSAELAATRRDNAAALERVRHSYERSRSWRVTEPLRAVGRWLRARR
jgi:SAM-dependent methyltransferase